ncbi:MAG: hypothetical protein V3R25_05905 [Nitrosomonadaceae bacterium]
MGIQTQAEHRSELEAEELAANESVTQDEPIQSKPEAIKESVIETEEPANSDDDGAPVIAQEDWMQSEASDSQSNDLTEVPDAVWAAVRKGAKAKAERVDEAHQSELAKMQAQIDAMSNQPRQNPVNAGRPQRSDFHDHDMPDDAYDDAMYLFRRQQEQQQLTQNDNKRLQDEFESNQDLALNNHYSRAEALSKQGISAEHYKHSDLTVRNLLGNDLTNRLITDVGEGSEKVFYQLGRNPTKLAELKRAMDEDPRGIKAILLLGKMSSGLSAQTKRKTLAPAPAAQANGGQGGGSSKDGKSAYEKASNSGDTSEAFNLRRAAKAAGTDTSNW